MGIEQVRTAVLANPVAAAAIYSKAELYAVIEDIAQKSKGACESIYQARARVSKTAEGATIMKAYSMAKATPSVVPVETKVSESEFRKAHDSAVARIDEIARKIAAEEKMPLTRARAEAWERNPAIKAEYDSNRRLRLTSGGRA